MNKLKKIYQDIKEVKIQGARNIAKTALYAYSLKPSKKTKKELISLRPTEPMLVNVLNKIGKIPYREIQKHFDEAQKKINKFALKIIKNDDVIFTHCHSTNVINALIFAKRKRIKFEVYNTETRPLYQGRKTARELKHAGIKVTTFVDAAARVAIEKSQGTKKVDKLILGADAILRDGSIINKIGSGMFAEIAYNHKIPLYIFADSWKFSKKRVELEQRAFQEIWKKAPENIKLKNPAFERVEPKYIKSIVSELGILTPREFVRKARYNL